MHAGHAVEEQPLDVRVAAPRRDPVQHALYRGVGRRDERLRRAEREAEESRALVIDVVALLQRTHGRPDGTDRDRGVQTQSPPLRDVGHEHDIPRGRDGARETDERGMLAAAPGQAVQHDPPREPARAARWTEQRRRHALVTPVVLDLVSLDARCAGPEVCAQVAQRRRHRPEVTTPERGGQPPPRLPPRRCTPIIGG